MRTSEPILLVEDDDSVREVAARILRERGYTVTDTGRVEEALALCRRPGVSFDLLLTDVWGEWLTRLDIDVTDLGPVGTLELTVKECL